MQTKLVPISSLSGIPARSVMQIESSLNRLPLVEHLLTGIEVEAENVEWGDGVNLYSAGWATHEDGSLRDGGVEWVLERPLAGAELATAVSRFYAQPLNYGPSPRAGTHVHVNMTDRTFGEVQAMLALMYCIDRLVFAWADEDRMWCSYCNSLNTLPPSTLRAALLDVDHDYIGIQHVWPQSTHDRYYGFNVAALWKYGTLEFRYFPTINSESKMWQWLDFCHAVYKWCTTALDPNSEQSMASQVLERVLDNPDELLAEVFIGADDVYHGLRRLSGWEDVMLEAAEELSLLLSVDVHTPAVVSEADSYADNFAAASLRANPISMSQLGMRPSPSAEPSSSRAYMRRDAVLRTGGSATIITMPQPTSTWEEFLIHTEEPRELDPSTLTTNDTYEGEF